MDYAELVELDGYERVYGPQGPERTDQLVGLLASVLANVHRDTKRRPKPYTADDFTPQWGRHKAPTRRQSAQRIGEQMMMFAKAFNRQAS